MDVLSIAPKDGKMPNMDAVRSTLKGIMNVMRVVRDFDVSRRSKRKQNLPSEVDLLKVERVVLQVENEKRMLR